VALRNPEDRRTLLFAAAMPLVTGGAYVWPAWMPVLVPLACFLALAAGVMAHNHNHRPVFTGRRMNGFYGNWLSLFYGYPTFAWIPTHNLNHHRFVNRPGDATITWRYSNRHILPVALTYFFVSAYWQSDPIKAYIRQAYATNRPLFRRVIFQYALWIGVALGLLAASIAAYGLGRGAAIWALASALPAVFALWTIMLFNYEQHVHADPWSEFDHSRSWTGRTLNALLFNNGYHAAHHMNPSLHWSELPRAHAELAPKITPSLIEGGMTWYLVKSYFLAPFAPRFGTKQVGRPGSEPPAAERVNTQPDVAYVPSGLGEAGDNAEFVGLARDASAPR
jgi:beta-carotene hydroxylase